MSALQVTNLAKTYLTKGKKIDALKTLSFTIEEGEIFGLLGPNGAGKSTLINILAGSVSKTAGEMEVFGKPISTHHAEVKRLIGVVPQEITFDPFFSIEQALRYQFGYYGMPVDETYLNRILDQLSLTDKRKTLPRQLSGGMKRRFMIAKALIHKPKLLVLDEPTAGVDIELRHDLYTVIRDLNAEGVTIILTSHYLEEVELLCERIAIVNRGELVALDSKAVLKDRFKSTRTFSLALTEKITAIPKELEAFSPVLEGTELKLTFSEHEYKHVLQTVAGVQLPIAHFRIIEPSLEDVFLSLTSSL